MSKYNKHTWRNGELITADRMNAIENQLETTTPGATIIANDYNSSTTYNIGEYCLYNGNLWRCISQSTDNTPQEGTYWTNKKITDEIQTVVMVGGLNPVITAEPNKLYYCGNDLETLTFEPSPKGVCEVMFSSGTPATECSFVVGGISWADNFDPYNLEEETVYKFTFNFLGYASAVKWAFGSGAYFH